MRHTVVLSDIHLCEAEPGTGLWMRYRQKAFSPDREIAGMLDEVRSRVRGDDLTVVLNGDVFDFDAPRVVGKESVFHNLPRDAEHAVPMLRGILDDHQEFIDALGRVVAEGHTLVFVSGNHDVQLTLPDVRALVAERVLAAVQRASSPPGEEDVSGSGSGVEEGHSLPASRALLLASAQERILFRAWFHKTPDDIIIEHGNQYDPYCCYRYPMAPFGRDLKTIQPTLGSLAARLLAARMGYFNPHVDSSFMLSVGGYIAHWIRYYMFSRRSLAFAWAMGAIRSITELARRRDPERRERRRSNIAACARETGVPLKMVARHARLFVKPAEDRLSLVARELWLDRVAIVLATALAAAALWMIWPPAGIVLGAVLVPALLAAYEHYIPKITLRENWRRVGRSARLVARVHRARAVIFGHTHHPEGAWEEGVFFGNTGSWSAAFRDLACTQPLFDERPLVWLTTGLPDGSLRGGLVAWKKGRFELRLTPNAVPASHAEPAGPGATAVPGATKEAPALAPGENQVAAPVALKSTPPVASPPAPSRSEEALSSGMPWEAPARIAPWTGRSLTD